MWHEQWHKDMKVHRQFCVAGELRAQTRVEEDRGSERRD